MAFNADYFLKKTLGEDFFESLSKFELWKPGTRTTVDHEEIKTALMIVPRTVMALMIRELTPMNVGETKEIAIPSEYKNAAQGMVRVTKHERDVYSGEIFQDNKTIVDFKYRSIPGVGLIIMSAFELYDTSKLTETHENAPKEDATQKIQQLIDERLALHDLIGKVVDKKIQERDAIKELLMAKISESLKEPKRHSEPENQGRPINIEDVDFDFEKKEKEEKTVKVKKESPLKGFLDKRKNKSKPSEFSIEMTKGEQVHCPDCKKNIFNGQVFSGCVCLGDDRDKKVIINKSENGIKIRFGHGWDHENIEMLLEVLRSKHGQRK